jgi:hypothetical protein
MSPRIAPGQMIQVLQDPAKCLGTLKHGDVVRFHSDSSVFHGSLERGYRWTGITFRTGANPSTFGLTHRPQAGTGAARSGYISAG